MIEERVHFEVDGDEVVGTLRHFADDEHFPALVFLGPLTSVKEQVPGHYAKALALRGFATLAIDNRHFGESGGQPRQYEDPNRKVADIRAALDWLAHQPQVDEDRMGAVGICAGAGYMSGAVVADPRIKAFGAVAGFFHDAAKQREWMGDRYEEALARAVKAREKWAATGECETIPAVGEGDVAMPLAEAFEYYGTKRGAHPNYVNAFAVMSREHTLPWDAQGNAAKITVPTYMIHSEKALTPNLARQFYANLGGPKEERWLESQGQIDFYDDEDLIEDASDLLAAHFQKM